MSISLNLEWSTSHSKPAQQRAGLRFGDRGTHTSRTMMLRELTELLEVTPRDADHDAYVEAIVVENVLGKETTSNRRSTKQRLSELYGLDPQTPIFRVLLRLWDLDEAGRPLLALLCALARDPLLRATAATILPMTPGQELLRSDMTASITEGTGGRLKDSVTDKVARNAGSSWTQSGHLEGRVRKIRQPVRPTAGASAFAVWLGALQGRAGESLLDSAWAKVLDVGPSDLLDQVLRAKQLGLLRARTGGGVVEIHADGIDPAVGGS